MKNKKDFCQNCDNQRKILYCIKIAKYNIGLCKQCWMGFALGLKLDIELLLKDETIFNNTVNQTGEYEK